MSNANQLQEQDRKRIRKVVICAPHPSNFQKQRMRQAIEDGEIVDLLYLAREMDECCNLAAELVGCSLDYSNFWTARVLKIYAEMGGDVRDTKSGEGFAIVL